VPSTAFSRAGFSDALVSRVDTCMVPVAVRFGPRSRVSPVFLAAAPVLVVDDVAPVELASVVAALACAASAAPFFLASALASPNRRPAALGACFSEPEEGR
jgi:hypothetical protein